jgi:hypothetical protein
MNDLFGRPISVFQPKQGDELHIKADDGTDSWFTPPEILRELGSFDLDPCTIANPPWRIAAKQYTEADDGLKKPWAGRVWLNPPYSQLKSWMGRMAGHRCGIALTFARTETEAFQDFVFPVCYSLLFIRGRISFYTPEGIRGRLNAGAPSVLISYTPEDHAALAQSGIAGRLVINQAYSVNKTNEAKLL